MALLNHRDHEDRPWGSFERFALNEPATVKIIRVNALQRFSLQHHERRAEFWRVIEGSGTATIGEETRPAVVGDEFEIPPLTKHRMQAGPEGIAILELSLGTFDESDIVRFEDDFGRT